MVQRIENETDGGNNGVVDFVVIDAKKDDNCPNLSCDGEIEDRGLIHSSTENLLPSDTYCPGTRSRVRREERKYQRHSSFLVIFLNKGVTFLNTVEKEDSFLTGVS